VTKTAASEWFLSQANCFFTYFALILCVVLLLMIVQFILH